MQFESLKQHWLDSSSKDTLDPPDAEASVTLQILRASSAWDWERARERARLVFCCLFAFAAIIAALAVFRPAPARVIALLFALALLVELGGTILLMRRRRRRHAGASLAEFIGAEHRDAEVRVRVERFSRTIMLILTAVSLVVLFLVPAPAETRLFLVDRMASTAILVTFLVLLWFRMRAGSRPGQWGREMEGYLRELEE